jgi:hypothetical protein
MFNLKVLKTTTNTNTNIYHPNMTIIIILTPSFIIELSPEFGFDHRTSKSEIFNHYS